MVRKITLKQLKFSQSDPVLIYQFSKKIVVLSSLDPAKIAFSPDPVLICAHLWCMAENWKQRENKNALKNLQILTAQTIYFSLCCVS